MKKPWIKFYAGDFLNGVADLDAEQRGAYVTVLCLIWDREGPIPDDAGWLARRIGISRRKWATLREQLLQLGKVQLATGEDGTPLITNARAMRDLQQRGEVSEKRRGAAEARWNGEQDLFGQESPENGQSRNANASGRPEKPRSAETGRFRDEFRPENGEKTPTFSARQNGVFSEELAENRDSGDASADANAFSLRARARSRVQNPDNTNNDHPASPARASAPAHAREGSADDGEKPERLFDLTMACCEAAGLAARCASRPALLTQSMEIVRGWIASGVDVRGEAVPLIIAQADRMNEPAHSLAKFSAAIDTHHAKAKRHLQRNGTALPPPPVPTFEFPDEGEAIAKFRHQLAKVIGRANYSQFCKALAFRIIDWRETGDGQALQVASRKGSTSAVWTPHTVLDRYGPQITQLGTKLLGTAIAIPTLAEASCSKPSDQTQ